MEIDDYLEAIRREGPLLLAAAAGAGLDAPVPSCPEWDVRDLVRHVAGVHHWAARQVGGRRTDELTGDLVDIVGGWPPDDELLDWAAEQHATLVAVLRRADRSFPYFTWLPGTTPFTMWTRRQAHETAVHRMDAELAEGTTTPFAPDFAADGVDELVMAMVGNLRKAIPVERDRVLRLRATDAEREWTAILTPEGFETHAGRHGDADCTLSGPAEGLYRAVWHRGGESLDVEGDPSVLEAWWQAVRPRWS